VLDMISASRDEKEILEERRSEGCGESRGRQEDVVEYD